MDPAIRYALSSSLYHSITFYSNLCSLVIAIIIFFSAIPLGKKRHSKMWCKNRYLQTIFPPWILVKETSFILLQGVPHSVKLDDVRDSLLQVKNPLHPVFSSN